MTRIMSLSELAQALFASPLQASDHPSSDDIRSAVHARLFACNGDRSVCSAYVAQEAGDHPDIYATRMRWALSEVNNAYTTPLAAV